jgi:hypothetical protein
MNSLISSTSRYDVHVLCNDSGAICPFCSKFNEIETTDSGIRLKDKTACVHANRVSNISRTYAPLIAMIFHKVKAMR